MGLGPSGERSGAVDVAACLALPAFRQGRLVAGGSRLGRTVRWVAVIEWPVEDFVSVGDLVLTTAVGCDEPRMRELVAQIARSRAAGICWSVGRGAPHPAVPPSVVAEAERHGLPLVEMPWRVRFSDLSRAVIQAINDPGGHDLPPGSESLPAEFTRALLRGSGVTGIAEALEEASGAPAAVLDSALTVLGAGPEGAEWIADAGRETALVDAVVHLARQTRDTPAPWHAPRPMTHRGEGCEVVAVAVRARDELLGWVVAVASPDGDSEAVERAVVHAGTAAAIELLRWAAEEEAESRARAEFAWRLADGGHDSRHDMATRTALLGLSLNAGVRVGLGLVETPRDTDRPFLSATEVARRLRRRLGHHGSIVAARENEILVCAHESEGAWSELLAEIDGVTISWGTARGAWPLERLAHGVEQARTALAVTRALRAPGGLGEAERLGAFMMLYPLVADPMAVRLAEEELAALLEADRTRGSHLLKTMRVFFEENGNISSSARRLYLNRHSLIYRLRKISQLTGRDLGSHEDRLVLETSLRIHLLGSRQDRP